MTVSSPAGPAAEAASEPGEPSAAAAAADALAAAVTAAAAHVEAAAVTPAAPAAAASAAVGGAAAAAVQLVIVRRLLRRPGLEPRHCTLWTRGTVKWCGEVMWRSDAVEWSGEVMWWNDMEKWYSGEMIWRSDIAKWQGEVTVEVTLWNKKVYWQGEVTQWSDNVVWHCEVTWWSDTVQWNYAVKGQNEVTWLSDMVKWHYEMKRLSDTLNYVMKWQDAVTRQCDTVKWHAKVTRWSDIVTWNGDVPWNRAAFNFLLSIPIQVFSPRIKIPKKRMNSNLIHLNISMPTGVAVQSYHCCRVCGVNHSYQWQIVPDFISQRRNTTSIQLNRKWNRERVMNRKWNRDRVMNIKWNEWIHERRQPSASSPSACFLSRNGMTLDRSTSSLARPSPSTFPRALTTSSVSTPSVWPSGWPATSRPRQLSPIPQPESALLLSDSCFVSVDVLSIGIPMTSPVLPMFSTACLVSSSWFLSSECSDGGDTSAPPPCMAAVARCTCSHGNREIKLQDG